MMKIKLNEMAEIKENEDIEQDSDIEIFEWAAKNGAKVSKGEKLLEVMVGKASIEIVSPADGVLTILMEDGEIVTGEDIVAEIV